MKTKKGFIFETNPQKANSKVTINSFMMGGLFFILTLIWTLNPTKFSIFAIAQIVFAIPFLFVSSLAYSKIGYWEKTEAWNTLGWFTNNIGNIFIINVVGLITKTVSQNITFVYFVLVIILMSVYSVINVAYDRTTLREKIFKFVFFIFFLIVGGIIPALF